MKKNEFKKMKSLLLCMMLIVAMTFSVVGCGKSGDVDKAQTETQEVTEVQETTEEQETTEVQETTEAESTEAVDATVMGEGQTSFMFTVVEQDGKETNFEIHTDKATVGEALLELNLIAGEEGEYGLYVKTVNGVTADYDVDQTYWAFYVDGEYASTGVDSTFVEEGKTYSFKVEK